YLNVPPRHSTPPPLTSSAMDIDMTPKHVRKSKDNVSQSPIPFQKSTSAPTLPFPLNYSSIRIESTPSKQVSNQVQ
ncbi:3694_t:CDS:1, partial [Ambispora leptoticha]